MKEKRNKIIIILIAVIIILVLIVGYGVYTGKKVKEKIISLNSEINNLNAENQELNSQLKSPQEIRLL